MDDAPDIKRQRISSATDQPWTNGPPNQPHRELPPPSTQSIGAPPLTYNPQPSPYTHPNPGPPLPQHVAVDDRRHHDGFPVAMHEPQRDMSGTPTSYGQYPGAIRDVSIKRDHSSEPFQHPRPNSTGHSEPSMMPHPEDPRRQSIQYHPMPGGPPPPDSYRNHAPYPMQPHHMPPEYNSQGYPPPQMYGNAPAGAPYPPGLSVQARKKAPRTSQACGQCRQAKAKCDDPKPCTACRKAGVICDFKPPEPKQADKIQQEILDRLTNIAGHVSALGNRMSRLERKLHTKASIEGKSESGEPLDTYMKDEGDEEESPSAITDSQPSQAIHEEFHYDENADPDAVESDGEGAHIAYPKNEPAIPEDHTTQASRMLAWPSINKYIGPMISSDPMIRNHHYTVTREVKRGVIRLYGRGESGSFEPESFGDRPDKETSEDASSDASASPAVDYLWGQTGSFKPLTTMTIVRSEAERVGGLDSSNAALDLSEATIRRLAQSYMRHMNILHPLIFPGNLERYIKQFLKSLPETDPASLEPNPSKVEHGFIGTKRKRENEADSPPVQLLKPGKPQRSIETALVLVILALGRICEHRTKIPNVVPDYDEASSSQNGHPSPFGLSPGASPQSSFSSNKERLARGSSTRRNSTDSDFPDNIRRNASAPIRNMDVIPGLAYFAAATDIIGNQLGGNTLRHVQVNILAGLYHSQLARVSESHAYIHEACRALQVILLGRSERYHEMSRQNKMGKAKDTPVLLAFWTCLQLESDLIAELDFPQSGILRWEEQIPWPDGGSIREAGISSAQVNSYLAQLFVRKHLNKIHATLYQVGKEDFYKLPMSQSDLTELLQRITDSERLLKGFSTTLRPTSGEYEDPEVLEILRQRLEAKIDGALNNTYRPCLMMIMNRSPDFPFNQIQNEIRLNAQLCLNAMENSTSAFPMINGQRVIITNPWGTCHAQWGNTIALQAAYMDPDLRKWIDPEKLTGLIHKVLSFLNMIAQPSSSMAQDIKILRYMAEKVTKLLPSKRSSESAIVVGGSSFDSSKSGVGNDEEGSPEVQVA